MLFAMQSEVTALACGFCRSVLNLAGEAAFVEMAGRCDMECTRTHFQVTEFQIEKHFMALVGTFAMEI
jgi:hypothetical protein